MIKSTSTNSLSGSFFPCFSVSPGINKGPAESLRGSDGEGDKEIQQTDPPRSLLPAQQHDCTQRYQRWRKKNKKNSG